AGLLHRDVKPANVLRGPHGHRLIDFGIVVEAVDGAAPEVPRVVGTIGFVAPECLSGRAPSAANDLFALGVTLFVLAKGGPPGGGGPGAAARGGPARRRAPDLVRLVGQLLEADPRSRPRHAEWVAGEIERIRAASGLPRTSLAAWSPPARAREARTADISG